MAYEDPRVDDRTATVEFTYATDPEHERFMLAELAAGLDELTGRLGYTWGTVEPDARLWAAPVCAHCGKPLSFEDVESTAPTLCDSCETQAAYDAAADAADTVEVSLVGADPPMLLDRETPPGVWVRVGEPAGMDGYHVSVRGPKGAVRDFVMAQWGREDAVAAGLVASPQAATGYTALRPVEVMAEAQMLESVAGYTAADMSRELAFGVSTLDLDSSESIRWLLCLLARRLAEVDAS